MTSQKKTQLDWFSTHLGERLVSVYRLPDAGSKGVKLVLICDDVDVTLLGRLKRLPLSLKRSIKELKVFSQQEFETSMDVFPIEGLEIKLSGECVAGHDILSVSQIKEDHLRHQCEFYLRSHILKLRESYIVGHMSEYQLIQESFPAFMTVFRYLGQLWSVTVSDSHMDMVSKIETALGIDLPALKSLSNGPLKKSDAKGLFSSYLNDCQQVCQSVDVLHVA